MFKWYEESYSYEEEQDCAWRGVEVYSWPMLVWKALNRLGLGYLGYRCILFGFPLFFVLIIFTLPILFLFTPLDRLVKRYKS